MPEDVATLFLSIESLADIAHYLNISIEELERQVNNPIYHVYKIPKHSGGYRTIQAPENELKHLQQKLNEAFQACYSFHKPMVATAYTKNAKDDHRSAIYKNAASHIGKNYLMSLDLKDFFPSISARRIRTLFMGPQFRQSEQNATILALLTCYQGKLPIGAPSSPVLSNFVCLDLDSQLNDYCQANQITYTRYADDLSFSSDIYFDKSTINTIKEIIQNQGFTINEKKFRIQSKNKKQVVTGLTVNEKVNIDRKYIKLVRAKIHSIQTYGLEAAANIHLKFPANLSQSDIDHFHQQLRSQIAFIGQVRGKEDEVYRKMREGVD